MSGRPDHAEARWAGDGVEEAGEAPTTGVGPFEDDVTSEGGPVAADARVAGDPDAGSMGAEEFDAGSMGAETGPILTDVAALTAQRDEYLESLQRMKADFDNYRKRVARLQQEQSARAEANLVTKLLPVLDNLDLAWAHLDPKDGEGEPASEEARAIGQARGQLLDVLGKEGLERVDAVDVPFDPTVHDAVAHAEPPPEPGEPQPEGGEVPQGDAEGAGAVNGSAAHDVSVDDVLRAGYRWRGHVLRPAMVRVRG